MTAMPLAPAARTADTVATSMPPIASAGLAQAEARLVNASNPRLPFLAFCTGPIVTKSANDACSRSEIPDTETPIRNPSGT